MAVFDTLENAKKDDIMKQFEINSVGPFLATRAFRDHLRRASKTAGVAKIANVSSILASIASNDTGAFYGYRASKAALNMISASTKVDLKADAIASLLLHPGYVATDIKGHQGAVQASVSVAQMAALIEQATLEDSSKFFGENGEVLPSIHSSRDGKKTSQAYGQLVWTTFSE